LRWPGIAFRSWTAWSGATPSGLRSPRPIRVAITPTAAGPAPGCDQQFLARLVWLGGRQGLALEGVGAGSWQALLEAGLLPDLLAWLELDAAALEQVPGIGKARANKLAASFARARQRPLAQWLKALGLPAKQLPPAADWDALAARDLAQWQAEAGVGPARAKQLQAFFRAAELPALRERLRAVGVPGT